MGPDPDKNAAIEKMERPQNVAELRRFLGMINHQQKFIENLSEKTMPLRDLLSSKNEWHWGHAQEESFSRLKKKLLKRPFSLITAPRKKLLYLQTPSRMD